eukprot:GILK01033232.1.p2 GENE.GILK01033232.1~~GILK01033232.1.p2  ORF type:complete len:104 (-),score=2.56 GILK01033232.1:67-378(-)
MVSRPPASQAAKISAFVGDHFASSTMSCIQILTDASPSHIRQDQSLLAVNIRFEIEESVGCCGWQSIEFIEPSCLPFDTNEAVLFLSVAALDATYSSPFGDAR